METLRSALKASLKTLPAHPIPKETLDQVVQTLLQIETKLSAENQRAAWEYLLRNEILALAETEGDALKNSNSTYYNNLKDRLDLVLTFTELEACDQSTPLQIIQDLLETQTISSCSHIFSWIESRVDRLTKDMVPQKGKALIMLRTLNELLRRLSKMGSKNTEFCGRILMFLSSVFPLGERSGVNLRGEYGPAWDGPTKKPVEEVKVKEEDEMVVDEDKKVDFYYTFWSLQLPFSRPSLFATPAVFPEFKESVNKVLPVIKEATTKERLMMGSKSMGSSSANKRKRESSESIDELPLNNYFFAKFLTSPELLDLEIADTHFRRQFIFQLLILLQHLSTFTKTAKATWSNSRNKGIHADFTLDQADSQWVQDTQGKCLDELKQTTPNGRLFSDSVTTILRREVNWVRWKNEFCAPFDKEPWYEGIEEPDGTKRKVGFVEATKDMKKEMMKDPEEWEYRFGTPALTEIWEMGYKELADLQQPFYPGDVKDFAKKVKLEDMKIGLRKKQLASQQRPPSRASEATLAAESSLPAKPGTSPSPQPQPQSQPQDEITAKHEENKQRWNWLALRTARDQYLMHFGKIGSGDVIQLELEIEKEKIDGRAASPAMSMSGSGSGNQISFKDGAGGGEGDGIGEGGGEVGESKVELPEGGDVKMDDR